MKILRRMVFAEFIGVFAAAIIAVIMLFILVDFFDRVQRFVGEGGAPVKLLAQYLLYKLPQAVYDITPLNLPLAALITLGMLNRRRELMAMRAAGIPIRSVLRPVFFFALFMAVMLFVVGEKILPQSNLQQNIIQEQLKRYKKTRSAALKGNKESENQMNTATGWYRGSKGVYYISSYRINDMEIRRPIFLEMGKDFILSARTDAESVKWDGVKWVGKNVAARKFTPTGEMTLTNLKSMTIAIPEKPSDFEIMDKESKEMGFFELAQYIERLEAGGSDMRPFRVDLWAKLSYPIGGLILLALAIPLGLKSDRSAGVAGGIVVSLIICLAYYEFFAWMLSLGRGGVILSPIIAAWTAPALFGAVALPMYFKSN